MVVRLDIKSMRKLSIIVALFFFIAGSAQDTLAISVDTLTAPVDTLVAESTDSSHVVLITDVMTNVTVHQDERIAALLYEKSVGKTNEPVERDGYRVQIYSSNRQQTAKQEAIKLEKEMQEKLDVAVYVLYTPPFWKVRLGDFATYEDAQDFKSGFIRTFPALQGDTYVVRDQVLLTTF